MRHGRRLWLPAILAVLLLPPLSATAQSLATGPDALLVPGATQWRSVSVAGRRFTIYLIVPDTPPPARGYPVIYFLDADTSAGLYAGTAQLLVRQRRIDPVVLVGIGFPPETDFAVWKPMIETTRGFDYTPPAPSDRVIGQDPAVRPHGGANALLDHILRRIRPDVARRVKVDPRRQILSGHSYGGLFTLNALMTRPEAFSAYLPSSPSIWFGDRIILDRQAGFAKKLGRKRVRPRVMLSVGADEQPNPAIAATLAANPDRMTTLTRRRMVDNATDMRDWLVANGVDANLRVAAGAGHGEATVVNLVHGMIFAVGRESRP
jgi:predicted alpha/beta superfamily hydrolase